MKPTTPTLIVGIDPDAQRNGIATLWVASRSLSLRTATFPETIDYLKALSEEYAGGLLVIVEASWTTRTNWHLAFKDNKRLASAKGYDIGRNHETGRKLIEMCRHLGIEVVERKPLKKCWRGRDGKITHEEFCKFTGYEGARSNQETRDAALLAFTYL